MALKMVPEELREPLRQIQATFDELTLDINNRKPKADKSACPEALPEVNLSADLLLQINKKFHILFKTETMMMNGMLNIST